MTMDKISERICRIRKDSGLTQEKFAEKLHVSTSAVSKWETGKATPDIYTLQEIADVFQLSLGELIGEAQNKNEVPDEDVKERRERRKPEKRTVLLWLTALAAIVLCNIAVILLIGRNEKEELQIYVVDEFLGSGSGPIEYETVYHVVFEYKGEMEDNYPYMYAESLRYKYDKHFLDADAIVFSYWKKYESRSQVESVLEADYVVVLLPLPLMIMEDME